MNKKLKKKIENEIEKALDVIEKKEKKNCEYYIGYIHAFKNVLNWIKKQEHSFNKEVKDGN